MTSAYTRQHNSDETHTSIHASRMLRTLDLRVRAVEDITFHRATTVIGMYIFTAQNLYEKGREKRRSGWANEC
jgi:hypothetical protein